MGRGENQSKKFHTVRWSKCHYEAVLSDMNETAANIRAPPTPNPRKNEITRRPTAGNIFCC